MGRVSMAAALSGAVLFAATSASIAAVEPTTAIADTVQTPHTVNVAGLQKTQADAGVPAHVALVSSCEDPWYYRSLIEELTCGLSGQGWIN